ncbi:MAG: hypothetical protein HN352_17190 [Bacteroidetes bacterium]|jgi:hypothetical protein|nr:hypothetical protein [Bacteroidota bacterium]MBT3750284.1 hypothetical protein [Bacteroidota bacterium]MBT4400978.1 hypothetical protein [Bacteroidota bacterium]MBT4411650.1 hypothetical protein [Bacteroidota bacterium]MBT5428231.1 hypothetical protein [Bacteroidota bacterium]
MAQVALYRLVFCLLTVFVRKKGTKEKKNRIDISNLENGNYHAHIKAFSNEIFLQKDSKGFIILK